MTDDNTRKLDNIVSHTKARKDIGIRYMKSWERERQLKKEGVLKNQVSLIQKKISKGKTLEEIADDLETTSEEIGPIYEVVKQFPLDTDVEDIIEKIIM